MVVLISALFPQNAVCIQGQVEYAVQIKTDGLATWTVKRNIMTNETYEDLGQFQIKVQVLVETVKNNISRDMSAEVISITSTVFGSYIVVEYEFNWRNFGKVENSSIVIDDVFQAQNPFLLLYGDGRVLISYPEAYEVETVEPSPSKHDESLHELEWPGALDFQGQKVKIVLIEKEYPTETNENAWQNLVLAIILFSTIVGLSMLIIYMKRRNKKERQNDKDTSLPRSLELESAEDRIVKMLRSSGDRIRQSALVNHFGFSKAKTSQLLSALEKRKIVKRYKMGRDKIVVLVEKEKYNTQ